MDVIIFIVERPDKGIHVQKLRFDSPESVQDSSSNKERQACAG